MSAGGSARHEPWVGDAANQESRGRCAYSHDEGGPPCGKPATIHVLTESAIHGRVTLPTCDHHAVIARVAGVYVAEHEFGDGCDSSIAGVMWSGETCEPIR